jgi:hypothetical protein
VAFSTISVVRQRSETFVPSEIRRMSTEVVGVPLPGWKFEAVRTT